MDARPWLEQLEEVVGGAEASEPFAALAFIAAQAVTLPQAEVHAARRRALLLLAAGGDPRRSPRVDERAVTTLARDVDRPERRAELAAALALLKQQSAGLVRVAGALDCLLADPELAWRWLACALLAEELAGSDEG